MRRIYRSNKNCFSNKWIKILVTFIILVGGFANAQKWQLIKNPNTGDDWVAGFSVKDYGATGDGVTDVTPIFQKLMDNLGKIGGGAVYVPTGKYVIKGNLVIPKGVTLRGDWQKPIKGKPIQGTILMVYAGKGDESAASPFTLQPSGGIKDVAIWYPEQDPNKIIPYSPAILMGQTGYFGNDYPNAADITLVNAYSGIVINPKNMGGCPIINSIYGTPLSRGIEIDNIADVGHLDNINFSPEYWTSSSFPNSPKNNNAKKWIYDNGTGIVMRRNDWTYTSFVNIEGYHIGFHAARSIASAGSGPNGQNFNMTYSNCAIGILSESAGRSGMLFTSVNTPNCETGFHMLGGEFTKGTVHFYNSNLFGKTNAVATTNDSQVIILMDQCTITSGNVAINGGTLVASGNHFNNSAPQINLGNNSRGIITGNFYKTKRNIVNNSTFVSKIDDMPVALIPVPQMPKIYQDVVRKQNPSVTNFYVATNKEFGAVADGVTDNTALVQKALSQAAKDGGGIVFLPPGKYEFNGHLTIPSGVALEGALDTFSAPLGQGAILEPHADRGKADGIPFITMQSASGLRGVTFNYPDQLADEIPNVPAYPYTIQGKGSDIYIVNVAFRAVYNGIDFASYKCDRHYVNGLAGHVFGTVLNIGGGSTDGVICHSQFNPMCYGHGEQSKYGKFPNAPTNDASRKAVYQYSFENTYFLRIANASNELLYNNFYVQLHTGILFAKDSHSSASGLSLGSGVDGSKNALVFQAIGEKGFPMINTQIVAVGADSDHNYVMTTPDYTSATQIINSVFFGGPAKSIVSNGKGQIIFENVNLQNSGSTRFADLNADTKVIFKNSSVVHNNNMLLPNTEKNLSVESSIFDTNGIDITKLMTYKNVLETKPTQVGNQVQK